MRPPPAWANPSAGEEELVYPASFEYFAPGTLEEALSLLGERGDAAKVLAGGQSLIPLMKLRFAAPEALVDINRIAGLDTSKRTGGLRIGALVRHGRASDPSSCAAVSSCSATPRRRSPIRSCATAGRSAGRSCTRIRRGTGAQ